MYEDYKKSFQKNFDKLSFKYGEFNIFHDFVKICAISLYNSFSKDQKMEKEYLNTIGCYEKEDIDLFTKMFGDLIMMYQTVGDVVDILGPFYSRENLYNPHLEQYFTPPHIAEVMAHITIDNQENFKQRIKEKGFMTMCEPTCGSGVMIIALAKILKKAGINYQADLFVIANDISEVCVYMTYIQLSLYGIPAIVYCGDALAGKSKFKMETPLYFLQYWKFRNAFIKESQDNTNQKEIITNQIVQNKFKEVMVKGNRQISLF